VTPVPQARRRIVGIDLGTTNCAMSSVDPASRTAGATPRVEAIPQLVATGEVATRQTLPSFLYLPAPDERDGGGLALPWNPRPDLVAGVFARDRGALVPARQVSSAKSWLSNPSVDRRAALLPWTTDADERISPVDASARLLAHLRDAWNHQHAQRKVPLRLEDQDVVLTVPASFDEEARELTVEAAREVGLEHLTLLEEPLAALYAWMATHPGELAERLRDGGLLLVCDVGGGTTDFSLIRATTGEDGLHFERTAIGEHLLLGGDNMDLALAAAVEATLAVDTGGSRLTMNQRQSLRRQCCAAKERLLSEEGPETVTITVLGSGRGVVGGAMTAELTRSQVRATLETFLPATGPDDRPQRSVRAGLRELGLPYESDPAVTRHLAAFLARAGRAAAGGPAGDAPALARPDAVLFNGGFFTPSRARERVLEAMARWLGTRPAVLSNASPDTAVAAGAAFYGALRRKPDASRGLLVRAGSARTYYIGVQTAGSNGDQTGVCVMPRGTQEGTRLALDREFTVTTNQPATFTLFSALDRDDPLGAVVTFTEGEVAHRHAGLVTALRYGQRSRRVRLGVRLRADFTEVGTLELWCESQTTEHRWRLQFNLRASETEEPEEGADTNASEAPADQVVVTEDATAAAEAQVRAFFAAPDAGASDAIVGALENTLGYGKHAWPLPVIRRLADALLATADSRRAGARIEARWLNLVGFCLRPGFGTPVDPWRITEIRKVYAAGLVFPKDTQAQVEWLILWQRVAAGFTATQQQELARRMIGILGLGARKAPRLNPQMMREAWRLLASLERLDPAQRVRLGDELLAKVRREPGNTAFTWAIGRLGARTPLSGPLNAVVPAVAVERWLEVMVGLKVLTPDVSAAIVQMGARTDDPARDISATARDRTIASLEAANVSDDAIRPLRETVPVERLDLARMFGDALPEGLRLER
jgi:molecular chaperone DnaK (HSP70)